MSKEHSYAYDAGCRDDSAHYELEHCPVCKSVADLQEALDENARLLSQLTEWKRVAESKQDIIDHMRDTNAENRKLRELVDYMVPIAWHAASERERNHMRELGIEADK